MSAHTPGPWTVVPQSAPLDVDGAIVQSCNDHEIRPAHGVMLGDEMADLALIAAAPDLLAALQWLMTANGSELSSAFEDAQKAIAKATGVQP